MGWKVRKNYIFCHLILFANGKREGGRKEAGGEREREREKENKRLIVCIPKF